jgi:magnesium chelatase subunit I
MTHYPLTREQGMAITAQESWIARDSGVECWCRCSCASWSRKSRSRRARASTSIRTPASRRGLPIALIENLVSERRASGADDGDKRVVTRVCDLQQAVSAVSGKVELVLEGEQEGTLNVARAAARPRL